MANPWDKPEETTANPWDRPVTAEPNYNLADVVSEDKSINNNFIGRAKTAFGGYFDRKLYAEPAKAASQATQQMIGNISGLLTIMGDVVKPNDDIRENYVNMGVDNKRLQFADKVGDALKLWGTTSKEFWIKQAETGWEAEKDARLWEGSIVDNPSWTRAFSLGAGAIPSMGASVVASFATGNPLTGAILLGLVEAEPIYAESMQKEGDETKALGLFAGAATAITALEYLPMERFLRGGSGQLLKDTVIGGLIGGTQEGTQQLTTNLIRKYGIDNSVDLMEGVVDSIIAGTISEGITGGVTSKVQSTKLEKAKDYIREKIATVEQKANEMGLSPEEKDAVIMAVSESMVGHSDEVDAILRKEIDGRMSQFVEKPVETGNNTVKDETVKPLEMGTNLDTLAEQAVREGVSREEFVANHTKVFHQTSKEALDKISNEGFRIMRGESSQGDILPLGINTKQTDSPIALPDTKTEQIEVFLPKNAKVKEFPTREHVTYFLQFTDESPKSAEYYKLVEEQRQIDKEYGKKVDALEKYEKGMSDEEYGANLDKIDAVIDEWKEKFNVVGNKAAELGREIFMDLGYDAIKIEKDIGGVFKNKATDNLIIFKESLAKTKSQLTQSYDKAQGARGGEEIKTEVQDTKNKYESVKKVNKANENKLAKDTKQFIDKTFVPISTRLSKINDKLKYAVRKFDFNVNTKTNERLKKATPMLNKYSKLDKDIRIELDFALKNRDAKKVDEIVSKNGLEKEFASITETLNEIYAKAENVGLDINYLQDYFPRRVKDVEGFMNYLRQTENWSAIQEALDEEAVKKGTALTEEEQAEFINKLIRGFGDSTIKLSIPGNVKARLIEEVTPELNVFYKDSSEALIDYITAMTNAIEAREFFGKGDNIDKSIGNYIRKLVNDNMITASQEKEVRDILKARFEQRGTHGIWSTYKNMSYIYTMGSPLSAITQIGDQAFSLYKNGFYNTGESIVKTILGKDQITKEDLGIERIAEEFTDRSKSGKAVTAVFKAIGLEWMDGLGKSSLINGAYKRMKKLAKAPTQEFTDKMENIFGNEAKRTIKDLQEGNISTNVKMLLFSELADVQPISLSEMPEYYLKGGNMRIFYMLKTYTIKQIDVFHNEVFRKLDNPKTRLEGLTNLVKLSMSLALTGATSDLLKDLLLGREIKLDDLIIDNILKLMGFSKWQIYKSRKDGLLTAFMQSILPPVPFLDDMYKDIVNQKSLPDWRIASAVPLVGKFYYWWFGGGKKKGKKTII